MIAPVHLDEPVATCVAARKPYRRHRGFRAGINHAYFLYGRNHRTDQRSHLHFARGRTTKGCRHPHRFDNGTFHFRVSVSEYHRPPRVDKVDVSVAVFVVQVSATRASNKHGRASYGPKRPYGRLHTAGTDLYG